MFALFSLFGIVVASLIVTRVATIMLTLTGMSRESARFQARSAFSGAGFTTNESEAVVNHPVRRRIIMSLILLGNAGIVSTLAAFLLSFAQASGGEAAQRLVALFVGLIVLWRLSASKIADRFLSQFIERALRRFTDLDVRDYAGLLRLTEDWVVGEIQVEDGDWICDVPIAELRLTDEGVLVLGIERADGRWVGAPKSDASLHTGDLVLLYGRTDTLTRLDERKRDVEGEMDWVRSQIEFTEAYLEQQDAEHDAEDSRDEPASGHDDQHAPGDADR